MYIICIYLCVHLSTSSLPPSLPLTVLPFLHLSFLFFLYHSSFSACLVLSSKLRAVVSDICRAASSRHISFAFIHKTFSVSNVKYMYMCYIVASCVCVYACVCACVCACVSVCECVCVCVCVCVCGCVHKYVCVCSPAAPPCLKSRRMLFPCTVHSQWTVKLGLHTCIYIIPVYVL